MPRRAGRWQFAEGKHSALDYAPTSLVIGDGRHPVHNTFRIDIIGRSPSVIALLAEVVVLAAVSIRNLDDTVRERLRVRAAAHGRSMEAEMRAILVEAVREPGDDESLLDVLVARFGELGGIDLDLPSRSAPPRAVDFTT